MFLRGLVLELVRIGKNKIKRVYIIILVFFGNNKYIYEFRFFREVEMIY